MYSSTDWDSPSLIILYESLQSFLHIQKHFLLSLILEDSAWPSRPKHACPALFDQAESSSMPRSVLFACPALFACVAFFIPCVDLHFAHTTLCIGDGLFACGPSRINLKTLLTSPLQRCATSGVPPAPSRSGATLLSTAPSFWVHGCPFAPTLAACASSCACCRTVC